MSGSNLEVGTPGLRSIGPIEFGPDGVLFAADNMAARIVAVDVGDDAAAAAVEPFDVDGIDARLAGFLGCSVDDVAIRDIAVHPRTQNVYLAVMRGAGDDAIPVLARLDRVTGSLDEVVLADVPFAAFDLRDAPSDSDERQNIELGDAPGAQEIEYSGVKLKIRRLPARTATVTDMAYVDGTLLVAGMSNEEFASTLRQIPYPFTGDASASALEIFHVSHGAWETAAPIRTFVPYRNGEGILASYTCTPVVHFPLTDLTPGTKAVGRTVAELGPMNQPLDMVSFDKDGAEYLLVANSRHGLIKIACSDIDTQEPLTEPREPIGVPREAKDLAGITRLAPLNGDYVLALQRGEGGGTSLRSFKTASL